MEAVQGHSQQERAVERSGRSRAGDVCGAGGELGAHTRGVSWRHCACGTVAPALPTAVGGPWGRKH